MNTIREDGGTIYRLLLGAGFNETFSQWITAQSAHETANFTSYIYRDNLNAFGMTYQGQKEALGEKNGYAYYDNYPESVADYRRLFRSYGFVSAGTVDSFVKLLKGRGYFTAPEKEYLAGVKFFLKLYFPGGKIEKSLIPAGAGGSW